VRRLRLVDIVLLVTFVPLWVLCFALYVQKIAHGRAARVPVFVSAPATIDAYPVVRGFWPGTGAEQAGLLIGDHLTQVGAASLQGVGPFGFLARVYAETGPDLQASFSVLRGTTRENISLALNPLAFPWRTILLIVGFAATGTLVLLHRPGLRVARAFFLAGMTYSLHWTFFAGGPLVQTYAWIVVLACSSIFMFPFFLRVHLLLPEEFTLTGTRLPLWPWLFTIYGPVLLSRVFGVPLPPAIGFQAEQIVTMAFVVTLLLVITQQFRHAGPIGRRQFKWVVYGAYVGLVPVLAADTLIAIVPVLWPLHEVATIFVALIPICLGIAIIRFNLLDIDRLISSTAALSLLVLVLGAGALLLVPRVAHGMSRMIGVPLAVSQLTLSLMLALTIMPGQRYLRPRIERLFFSDRYRVEQGVRALIRELGQCTDRSTAMALVGERVHDLWRPESCVLYARVEEQYLPLFAGGSAIPPGIEAHSLLIEALHGETVVSDMERWRRRASGYFRPVDFMTLDNLRAACLVSLDAETPPSAFASLGVKQSGDVYTLTDVALLTKVAREMASTLARCRENGAASRAAGS
jgi:hypothetical protein